MTATRFLVVAVAALVIWAGAARAAQRGGGAGARPSTPLGASGQGAPPPTPKSDAAIDLTGTWTAVITEDWPLRMVTPKKGDYTRVPMTPTARRTADAWDPAKDEAAGEQCRGYGAPGVMRLPGRLRVGWVDDHTLKMELEAGNQMRLFHFTPAAAGPAFAEASARQAEPTWQGQSVAQWQYTVNPPRTGELKVVTNRLRAGYLRKNGVPYSANTTMTEYYHRMTAPNGDVWLTVVAEITDSENLREPFVQSTHFKRLAANAAFKPEACEAR
ncbi:MAG TPA: hypothetical protein VGJ78_25085 [Vicinamibacterales bacterium]|jgi:hypothetical protein